MVAEEGRLVAGRYRLLEHIGRGGMGTVWRAEDELLGRHVALKKLHVRPELGDDDLTTLHERTRREARSAARISHPGVVGVHDVVDDEGLPCIVMEYVPSETLGELLKRTGPVSPAEAARIGRCMIAALRAAHAAGVLHRDVKPANVLLGRDGRVVLTDFGIAMASGTSTLTKTGELVGSVDYVAPERVRGATPGPASDLWALGATLYQAVEGRPPFRKDTAIETAYAIAVDPLRPPLGAGGLAGLIEELLAKDPADRPSAEETERRLRGPEAEAATAAMVTPAGPAAERSGPADGGAAGPYDTGSGGSYGSGGPIGTVTDSATAGFGPAGGDGPRGRGRRALWAGTAALIAVATVAVSAFYLGNDRETGASSGEPGGGGTSPSASSSPGTSPKPPPPVPNGYRLVKAEQLGISFPVPDGWRIDKQTGTDIFCVDPTGLVGLRINVLDFASPDHLAHWEQVEKQTRAEQKGYRRLRMQRTTFRGQPAAVWEFAFRGTAREFRAIDLGFGREGEKEYALYLSAPIADWARHKPVFDNARAGLRLPKE